MLITKNVIPEIEKALGFELYDNQKVYLLGKGSLVGGRGTGKTVAYCVRLALSEGEPLNLLKPEEFSDGWSLSNHRSYARKFFVDEFLKIRMALKNHGFIVRDIKY